jgi:hypothetical protein
MTTKKQRAQSAAAAVIGRLGGLAGTKAQHRARQQNAKKAGRPGRVCVDCGEPVHGGHKDKRQDRRCQGQTWRWAKPGER